MSTPVEIAFYDGASDALIANAIRALVAPGARTVIAIERMTESADVLELVFRR